MPVFKKICLLLFSFPVLAASNAANIQTLIDKHFPDAHVGVFVQRADTGEVLANINGDQHFTPASTSKVFTAYAALKSLKPEFTFNTGVYWDAGTIAQGVYKQPIYLKFSGDPSLTSEDVATFVRAIKSAGVSRLEGPIILDGSIVPPPYYALGWPQDDLIWYYAAPVSGAIIDENKIGLQLLTSTTPNRPIQGRIPSNPSLLVTSYLKTATEFEANHLCQFNASIDHNNQFTVYGCWPALKGPVGLSMSIANPIKRISQILEAQLKAQQIVFTSEIKEGKTPITVKLLTEHRSETLAEMLNPVLTNSHNLYAEAIGKQIGLRQNQRATFQAGAYAVERLCYDNLKLPAKSLKLYDGSGLSSYSMATPQSLAAVLKAGYADEVMRPILMDTLSQSGTSGTLAGRMATQDLAEKFIGKTGAMGHISNVAGYLFPSPQQSPLIVVVMVNETAMKKPVMRRFEIELMRVLIGPN